MNRERGLFGTFEHGARQGRSPIGLKPLLAISAATLLVIAAVDKGSHPNTDTVYSSFDPVCHFPRSLWGTPGDDYWKPKEKEWPGVRPLSSIHKDGEVTTDRRFSGRLPFRVNGYFRWVFGIPYTSGSGTKQFLWELDQLTFLWPDSSFYGEVSLLKISPYLDGPNEQTLGLKNITPQPKARGNVSRNTAG